MSADIISKRVIINFTKKCALNCEWCYVPFDSQSISKERLGLVIERINQLGFNSVTFGGGDPFQFKYLNDVIDKSKALGLFVHVDTHAVTLSENYKNSLILNDSIDLIGLPLDGTKYAHDLMRGEVGHYDLIKNKLIWLKKHEVAIKINTVVSLVNKDDLQELGKIILDLRPSRWSIYQFWPVGPAKRADLKHLLTTSEFENCVNKIDSEAFKNITELEINTAESRRNTYPILNHNGDVYFHLPHPKNDFQYIGSIFDENISEKIDLLCSGEREQALSRYFHS